ncbi:MAG: hypothetical protein IKS99_05385, partial [Firmicutes bacterium]|nr:hypothetical protein [Bacillota bacterium]
MSTLRKTIVTVLIALMLAFFAVPGLEMCMTPESITADAATSYYKFWGSDVSEGDLQMMADKWPDYEPLRCNGWMNEVMNEVYDISMNMGSWVDGTRYNFTHNSTIKPTKVVEGTYQTIKDNMDKIKPGDIVFFNYASDGKGVWSHVAIMGEKNILWHCTATSPGSKTGKYLTLLKWMDKYGGPNGEHGSPGTYAEVWRVLSTFDSSRTVVITKGALKGKKRTVGYSVGKRIVVKETIAYEAYGPIVGKKVSVTAKLCKNKKVDDGYVKGITIANGERFYGNKELKYTVKKSGKMFIYYRFNISKKKLSVTSTLTPHVTVKIGKKTIVKY